MPLRIISKNLYNLICNIHKAKHNTGASTTGFYIGGDFIEYNDPKFTDLSRKLIAKYGDKLKDELKAAAHKRVIKGIPNIKIAEDDKVFIDSKLASYLENPNLAIKNIGNAKKSNDKIGDEITYRKIGEALVYRTTEFVSKLANTTTKINSTKFKQLMIDAFNAEEEENFLYGIVDIEAKMRIDAAKQTVQQVAGNNDALNKFGADKSDELENESISDSYYADISAELKTTNLLYESENVQAAKEYKSSEPSPASSTSRYVVDETIRPFVVNEEVISNVQNDICLYKIVNILDPVGGITLYNLQILKGNKDNPPGMIVHNIPETLLQHIKR